MLVEPGVQRTREHGRQEVQRNERQETLKESFIAVVDARSSLYASPPRHSGTNTMAGQAIPS